MHTNSVLMFIFECVVKSSWQAAVLVGLVLAVQRLLAGKLSPRWRYGLWFLVLARLLIPVAPESAFSIYNLAPDRAAYSRAESGSFGREPAMANAEPQRASAQIRQSTNPPIHQSYLPPPPASQRLSVQAWLIALWLAGIAVLAGYFAWAMIRFGRRVRRHFKVNEASVIALLEEAKRVVGVRVPVQLVETLETPVPAMFGLVRPRLLMPWRFAESFSAEELRLVFLHELTHLKRRDHVVNWFMFLATLIHWFNPFVWLAFARMRADRELACDEHVLSLSPERQNQDYGQMLIKLLEGLPRPARLPGLIGIVENTNQLKRRITMIAKFKRPARWSVLLALPVIALGLITLTDAQTKKERADKEIIAEIEKLGGKVKYDEIRPERPVISVDFFVNDEDWWKSDQPLMKVDDAMLSRFAVFKELEELDLTDAQITDEGLAYLKPFTRLKKLSLLSTRIDGSGLRHLRALTHLIDLDLRDTQVTDAGLSNVKDFPNLEVLRLNWARKLTDAGLVHLKSLVNLEKLELWGTKISDAGVAHLTNLTNLKHVDLNQTRITGASWDILCGFTNLTELRISSTGISDAGLAQLKRLPKLEVLHLGGSKQVTDLALQQLQDLPRLKVVSLRDGTISEVGLMALKNRPPLEITTGSYWTPFTLSGPTITDSCLVHLKRLSKLKSLSLRNTRITEQGMAHLKEIPGLEVLHLTGAQIGDSQLAHLRELRDLKALFLADSQVTDAGLKHIQSLRKLTVLDLKQTKITDAGLERLNGLSELEILTLGGTQVSDAGMAYLKSMSKLYDLDLSNTRVSGAGLVHLSELQELNSLYLSGTSVTDTGLAPVTKLSKLTSLLLNNTHITDAILPQLASLPRLGELGLGGTRITDAGLEHLKEMKSLYRLVLGRTKTTDGGLAQLKKIPGLRMLNLQGADITDAGLIEMTGLPNLTVTTLTQTKITRNGLRHLKAMKKLDWVRLDAELVDDEVRADFQRTRPDISIVTRPAPVDFQ
ncbi:MAG: hypothetical protein HY735_30710 [Verrucomicrobia bacterium]|nr:hypothetical protein [Verrucomicrobiota bacterium]